MAVESYLFAHAMSFRTYVSSDSSLRACLASRTITVAVATMRMCVGRIQKHGGAACRSQRLQKQVETRGTHPLLCKEKSG